MSGHITLKRGDNDKTATWGGSKLKDAPPYTVENLQKDLKTVGAATTSPDADFGKGTEKSLKIFQWVCGNLTACIKNSSHFSTIKNTAISPTGKLDETTLKELKKWVVDKQTVTGDLVRVTFDSLTNIEAGSGFKKLGSTKVFASELVISKAAVSLIKDLNAEAKKKSVTIKINQAFREHGTKVTGAVVPPATKSQHLIGHALDCNIVDGNNWNNSATFKQKKETKNAKDIIAALKKVGFRWGGDFSRVDTPHFDKKLDCSLFDYDAKFYLNQRAISENHAIPKETMS